MFNNRFRLYLLLEIVLELELAPIDYVALESKDVEGMRVVTIGGKRVVGVSISRKRGIGASNGTIGIEPVAIKLLARSS